MKLVKEANRALKKLRNSDLNLQFPPLGDPSSFEILAFSDATYASLGDGASQGAFIIFVQGSNGLIAPICWQSKKLHRVTKSPLASETLAVSEAADAGYLIACMISEIFKLPKPGTIKCYTDNKSLYESVQSATIPSDRRLRVDLSRIREMVDKQEVELLWINGKYQVADCLTKRGASSLLLFETLVNCRFNMKSN